MNKALAFVVIISTAVVSAYFGVGAEDPQKTAKTDNAKTGLIFEDVKTEDGRYDLSAIVACTRLPDERKEAFAAGDLDHDGFLTQKEFDAVVPRDSEEEIDDAFPETMEGERMLAQNGPGMAPPHFGFGPRPPMPPFSHRHGEHRGVQPPRRFPSHVDVAQSETPEL